MTAEIENHGIFTNTIWASVVIFKDAAGTPVPMPAGPYVMTLYDSKGSPAFVYRSSGAVANEGLIDITERASGQFGFTADLTQHANVAAALYDVQLQTTDGFWQASGQMLVGRPGTQKSYLRFDKVKAANEAGYVALPIQISTDIAGAFAAAAEASADGAEANAVAAAADRVQTGLDRAATAADRAAADANVIATAADRVQTGLDRVATAADRVQTGLDLTAAAASAADAIAASVVAANNAIGAAASYASAGGTGDRTASITASITASLLGGGVASNLVDGGTANNLTDSVSFNAVAVAGLTIRFDFGAGASKIITEARWKQSGAQSHGTWRWQASNDASSWTDIGTNFTLGGATTQLQAQLAANTTGYRYYQLLGISGTASAAPYVQEVEFKIINGILDSFVSVPAGGNGGDVLEKATATSFDVQWSDRSLFRGMYRTGLLAEWHFDDGSGDACRDLTGNYPISIAAGVNVSRTPRGLRSASGVIRTPSLPSARTFVQVFRCGRGETGKFVMSNSGAGMLVDGASSTWAFHIGNGWGVHPILMRSNGANTHEVNRGGFLVLFSEMPSAVTGVFGAGGRSNDGTFGLSDFELVFMQAFSGTLDSAARNQIYDVISKALAPRGVVLNWRAASTFENIIGLYGESNPDGRDAITSLSAADQALRFSSVLIQPGNNIGDAARWARSWPLELGLNQQITNVANFGYEFGMAFAHRASQNLRMRPLHISKFTRGSTSISPTFAAASCWNASAPTVGGLFANKMRHLYDLEQSLRMQGIGPRYLGYVFDEGLNSAVSTINTIDAATYQGYYQDHLDKFNTYTGLTGTKVVLVQTHSSDPSSNATALSHVQTGKADFVTANPSVATLISVAGYTLLGDQVHWNAASLKGIGQAAMAPFATDLAA